MKIRKLLLIGITALSVACAVAGLSACSNASVNYDEADYVKVTFYLEGGVYKNCTDHVDNYYAFEPGTENLICELGYFSKAEVTRANYTLEGWYRTCPGVDGVVEYSGKWDFDKDTVTDAGVKLYARWSPNVKYTYNVCYRDAASGELVSLYAYEVKQGETFKDSLNKASTRSGYTFLGSFVDENGQPWDENFTHPGGEENLAINVFPVYVEGVYTVVRTATEFSSALSSGKGIYLMNDLDMGGAAIRCSGASYKNVFRGNGYTVSNFTIGYNVSSLTFNQDLHDEDGQLCVSLFGKLEGAKIYDVTFADFSLELDADYSRIKNVFVAPLCMTMKDSEVKNVTFTNGTLTCKKLASKMTRDNLHTPEGNAAFFVNVESSSVVENVSVSVENKMYEYFNES